MRSAADIAHDTDVSIVSSVNGESTCLMTCSALIQGMLFSCVISMASCLSAFDIRTVFFMVLTSGFVITPWVNVFEADFGEDINSDFGYPISDLLPFFVLDNIVKLWV